MSRDKYWCECGKEFTAIEYAEHTCWATEPAHVNDGEPQGDVFVSVLRSAIKRGILRAEKHKYITRLAQLERDAEALKNVKAEIERRIDVLTEKEKGESGGYLNRAAIRHLQSLLALASKVQPTDERLEK